MTTNAAKINIGILVAKTSLLETFCNLPKLPSTRLPPANTAQRPTPAEAGEIAPVIASGKIRSVSIEAIRLPAIKLRTPTNWPQLGHFAGNKEEA